VNRSYYTHQDSDGLSNSDEDETGQDYRLLMAYDSDDFWDSLEEDSDGIIDFSWLMTMMIFGMI